MQIILDAKREMEHRDNKFKAAIAGIDLDAHLEKRNEEKFAEVEKRAMARLYGDAAVRRMEYDDFGLEIEVEE